MPSASALRPSPNQPRPRIAASQQYRSNPGWIRPVDNPHMMSATEEIPMPYEGQADGNTSTGRRSNPYGEGYGDGLWVRVAPAVPTARAARAANAATVETAVEMRAECYCG